MIGNSARQGAVSMYGVEVDLGLRYDPPMFHTYQTKEDIRRVIVETLIEEALRLAAEMKSEMKSEMGSETGAERGSDDASGAPIVTVS